jgi:hypothetical protein
MVHGMQILTENELLEYRWGKEVISAYRSTCILFASRVTEGLS